MSAAHILVIDDETPIIRIVQAVLAGNEYTVFTANSGERGVEMADLKRPDVIILDRYMPDIDGNEVLKQLKGNKATAKIPVIMLTSENKIKEVKKSIDLGAEGYIIKPFKSGDFKKKIDLVFDSYLKRQGG